MYKTLMTVIIFYSRYAVVKNKNFGPDRSNGMTK